ncbi:hypothetical protein BJ546DRAFT_825851, partial [Cryomyces antarcticus]
YSEDHDMAQWGTAVYSTRENASELSAASGNMDDIRSQCTRNGKLSGAQPPWSLGDVTAYAHDLGSVGGAAKNITFTIGYAREEAINYNANLNSKATAAGGSKYSDILALSLRHAFGAIGITIPKDTLDTNVMMFMKEISSNDNVNTTDVLLPSSPVFCVLAPEYIHLLLEPVVQYLSTAAWPLNHTIHDIGSAYPNATGHSDGLAEPIPIEEPSHLLTLAYTYVRASGNAAWAATHDVLSRRHADYLAQNGLYPTDQLSTD